jgi:hypothetical protein
MITNRLARQSRLSRPLRWALPVVALAATLGGCKGLLDVQNPSAITEDNLKGDEQTVIFMENGIKAGLRGEYPWMAAMGAAFTDEAISGHGWQPWNAYDERKVPPDNGAHAGFTYGLLQRARGTADALIPKMRAALGNTASNNVHLANALAYAGYDYLLMADHLCSAPIEAMGKPVTPDVMYQGAITRFTEAITIANAAGAPDIANLAKVGLARAQLNLGKNAEAIAAATGVPTDFNAWLKYTSAASLSDWQIYDFYAWWAGAKAGELDLAYPSGFSMSDRRIPYVTALASLSDGRRQGYRPLQTESFSGYDATGSAPIQFDEVAGVRFASGLEAQYMIAEASLGGGTAGWTTTQIVTFIGQARTRGGQSPYAGATTTDALRQELIDQRKRDFYLAGYRVGDLRRYKKLYGSGYDFWPKGLMPGLTETYGTDECWPMDINELNGNPNAR